MSAENAVIDITRYTIISKIGEGGFGKVYRVKDVKTKKNYAAKVSKFMIDEETKDSQEARLLFREVNLMSLLNHPTVLKFVGYYPINFEGDPLPTIVTELAMNGSLEDIIKMESQGLSPDEWTITKKLINIYGIAAGMSYLHSHNVLHRDLKPANILVDIYLHPKISDFGLSKITDFLSVSMNYQSQAGLKGTPAYMAPEIMSEEKYSKSSDVYAFGFIVFEILTCEKSFQNYDIFKLMKKVINEGHRPTISEDVPDSYRDLIERCWSQDPEERPSFDEIVSELKTKSDFITESVDELEFFDYVDFIDKYTDTFDVKERTIHFSKFIQKQGRNKNIQPILFNKTFSEDQQNEKTNDNDDYDQSTRITYISDDYDYDKEYDKESTDKSSEITTNEVNSLNENEEKINESEIIPTKINESEMNPTKINESETNSSKMKEIEESNERKMIYPIDKFNELSKNNQLLVESAINDSEQQFLVGKFLIEGQNEFLTNIDLGIQYLEKSIEGKCNNALFYYIKIHIQGKIIPPNFEKASKYLDKMKMIDDPRKYLLQGLYSHKNNRFSEALRYYEEGMEQGNLECMYKLGKMHFLGEGIQKNNNKSIKYFQQSKELGYEKSDYFLTSFDTLNQIKNFSELPPETQMIFITNNIKNIIENKIQTQETQFNKINLHPKNTEKVYFNKSLKTTSFYEILKLYQHISIEIGYPSESFKLIIDLVIKIRKKQISRLNIGIVFTSFSKPFSKKCFSTDISYHRIDSSIHIIPKETFKNISSLTKISIPSSVNEIGEKAFSGIKSLEITGNIQIIHKEMFYDCSSLKQITIPSSVTSIGDLAFSRCSSLKQITIPSSVTQIGDEAFFKCSSLKQITIPSSVTQIGGKSFFECSSLKQITIPSSVTQIGGGIFNKCIKLQQFSIQGNNEPKFAYYEGKFFICKSVSKSDTFDTLFSFTSNSEKVILPTFIIKIGDFTFFRCSSLTQITIPSSVTQIGDFAFFECSSLKQITIPSSVTKIENGVFYGCSSLTQITIPSSVTSIGKYSFYGCSSLTQITIPSSVTSIGKYSFYGCSSLTQITIPSSVTKIEKGVFFGCSSLTQITIPSSVTKIEKDVFFGCSSLKQITIPSSVTSIGSDAFSGCSSLKQITIPSSLNTENIGLNSNIKITKK